MMGGYVLQWLAHKPHLHIESSISAYYYTGMRNIFVGLLCAIGVFHLATEGYDLWDRIAGRLVCGFAFGVAWFPTTPDSEPKCPAVPADIQNTIGNLHYTFAALLFLTLAFFCIFQFTQTTDVRTRTRRKKERNFFYYVCGYTIIGCIVVIGVINKFGDKFPTGFLCWLKSWEWTFWFESLALLAFGAAFLIKGEFILKDETAPLQPDRSPQDDSL